MHCHYLIELPETVMPLLDALKKTFARSARPPQSASPRPKSTERAAPLRVPEVTAGELMAELAADDRRAALLLDCREAFERRQAFIPGSLHIAMNTIPDRLSDLQRDQEIVVYCAHGNRSYSVAGWLIQQGFAARSLQGGIVDWQAHGGPIESALRRA